jgi:glycosyltransferase involved in cell wall biosynthesis
MLADRDLVVLSGDWDQKNPGVVQHVVEIFARRNRVLWVSGTPIRGPRFRLNDVRRIMDKGRKMLGGVRSPGAASLPVSEIHPFFLPFYDSSPVRRVNDALLRNAIRSKVRELGFSNVILLPSNPMVAGVVGTCGESSSHYLCVDDYGANEGTFRCLGDLEREILQRVDSSFSMSDVLMKSRIPRSGENHFFPEGVDLDHFTARGGSPPAALVGLKRPIVGYFGLLASWVDYELLRRCAAEYPHVSFVALGKVTTDISPLYRQSNITCLGHIPYEVLPRYAEWFDVGLIPRLITRLTVAMNPKKLLEYLALGTPVVSTDLPEARKFGDLVFVAKDGDEFVRYIGEALKDNTPERARERRACAERWSWDAVADGMGDIIQRVDERKAGDWRVDAPPRAAAP